MDNYYIFFQFVIGNHTVINPYYSLLLHEKMFETKYHINKNMKVESNNELKQINVKYHVFYYYVDIININDLDLDNI